MVPPSGVTVTPRLPARGARVLVLASGTSLVLAGPSQLFMAASSAEAASAAYARLHGARTAAHLPLTGAVPISNRPPTPRGRWTPSCSASPSSSSPSSATRASSWPLPSRPAIARSTCSSASPWRPSWCTWARSSRRDRRHRPADRPDHRHRRHRVLHLCRLDAARRSPRRSRGRQAEAHDRVDHPRRRDRVLPGGARRQDDARHHHARDPEQPIGRGSGPRSGWSRRTPSPSGSAGSWDAAAGAMDPLGLRPRSWSSGSSCCSKGWEPSAADARKVRRRDDGGSSPRRTRRAPATSSLPTCDAPRR